MDFETCQNLGLFGQFLADMHTSVERLKRLELTDVELSVLAAMVLFSPGKLNYLYTLCMKRITGIWRVVIESKTIDKKIISFTILKDKF